MIKLKKILAEDKYDDMADSMNTILGTKLESAIETLNDWDGYIDTFNIIDLLDNDVNDFLLALIDFKVDVSDTKFNKLTKESTKFKNKIKSQIASDLKSFESKMKKIEAEYSKHKKR